MMDAVVGALCAADGAAVPSMARAAGWSPELANTDTVQLAQQL
jgi:hypothetical protein